MNKTIRVFGVPMDLGQQRRGVDMGPSALRYAGLQQSLTVIVDRIGFQRQMRRSRVAGPYLELRSPRLAIFDKFQMVARYTDLGAWNPQEGDMKICLREPNDGLDLDALPIARSDKLETQEVTIEGD